MFFRFGSLRLVELLVNPGLDLALEEGPEGTTTSKPELPASSLVSSIFVAVEVCVT